MRKARREKRITEGGSGSGPSKRQLDQIPASSYQDAEQALEAGVELEEKAERFSIGEKARKYYILALEVYQRCLELDNHNANAAYNAARILFILATAFAIPEESIERLQQACEAYGHALSHTLPLESDQTTPSAFYLDIEYNLAVALTQRAEQIDRIGGSNEKIVTQLLRDAIASFWNVLQAQQTVLQWQRQDEMQSVDPDVGVAKPLYDPATSDVLGDTEANFTVSPITPASVLETVASLHSAACSLIETSQSQEEMKQTLETCNVAHTLAQDVCSGFPDAAQRSGEIEWAEQVGSLRYAHLELRIFALSMSDRTDVEHVIQTAISEAEMLLRPISDDINDLKTTIGRAEHQIRTQHLHQLGDHLLSLAKYCLGRHLTHIASTQLVQLSWQLLTLSSKLFLAACKALDDEGVAQTAAMPVIGPEKIISATMRRRCALFTALSTVSGLRSHHQFTNSNLVAGADDKTRRTLLDNARVYARKALAEVGLAWLLQGNASAHAKVYRMPHGGLDSLGTEVDAALALLNALCLRHSVPELLDAVSQETTVLVSNLTNVILSNKTASAGVWKVCMGLSKPDSLEDGRGLIEQYLGDDGSAFFSASERAFWGQLDAILSKDGNV
jgi:tetratricopeptide (TPR) repeat protein